MIQRLLRMLDLLYDHEREQTEKIKLFDKIVGYDGIKHTFVRSLGSGVCQMRAYFDVLQFGLN